MPETTSPKFTPKKSADNSEKFFELFKEILETQTVILEKVTNLETKMNNEKADSAADAWGDM